MDAGRGVQKDVVYFLIILFNVVLVLLSCVITFTTAASVAVVVVASVAAITAAICTSLSEQPATDVLWERDPHNVPD